MAAGHTVRYEPAAVVTHRNRTILAGTGPPAHALRELGGRPRLAVTRDAVSTGRAERLEPGGLGAAGGRRAALVRCSGAATAAGSTAALVPKLRGRVDDPSREAGRLGGAGNLWAGRWLARADGADLATRRRRRRGRLPPDPTRAALAAVVPPLLEWRERRPDLAPLRWVAASVVDDVAYCAGVWLGCVRARSCRTRCPASPASPASPTADLVTRRAPACAARHARAPGCHDSAGASVATVVGHRPAGVAQW